MRKYGCVHIVTQPKQITYVMCDADPREKADDSCTKSSGGCEQGTTRLPGAIPVRAPLRCCNIGGSTRMRKRNMFKKL